MGETSPMATSRVSALMWRMGKVNYVSTRCFPLKWLCGASLSELAMVIAVSAQDTS